MEHRITDIHCLQCGAPAAFDIVKQMYLCGYCGGRVEISEAQREKQGFRDLQREKLRDSVKSSGFSVHPAAAAAQKSCLRRTKHSQNAHSAVAVWYEHNI